MTKAKLARGVAGERGPRGPQGEPGPSTGPAGGDLTGTYPNPSIRAGAVAGNRIADNTVQSGKLVNGAVTSAKLGNGAVTAPKLGSITRREGTAVSVPNGQSRLATASCQSGERMLSGGGLWDGTANGPNPNLYLVHSAPQVNLTVWAVRGTNLSGSSTTLRASVLCLL